MPSATIAFLGFVLVAGAAAWGILGLQWYNGFMELHRSFDGTELLPHRLPGTNIPTVTLFTGWKPYDEYLVNMVRFFVPGAFGESHALSLFSMYFLGQILPLHTFLLEESLKTGNAGTIISYAGIWGLIYQNVPAGVTISLYCAAYVLFSPLAKIAWGNNPAPTAGSLLILDIAKLRAVPIALIVGFVLPSVLSMPFFSNPDQQQVWLAAWQIFPAFVSICLFIFGGLVSLSGAIPDDMRRHPASVLRTLRKVNFMMIAAGAVVHWGVIAVATLPQLRNFIPREYIGDAVGLHAVFVPQPFIPTYKIDGYAAMALNLLHYDLFFSGLSINLLTFYLDGSFDLGRIISALISTFFLGPCGAALAWSWGRDERALMTLVKGKAKDI